MKRRFMVEMTWQEPGQYVNHSVIGVIAEEVDQWSYRLTFYGPYDKIVHNRQVIMAFAPGTWRVFFEIPEGNDWPIEPYKVYGEGQEQVTDADDKATTDS